MARSLFPEIAGELKRKKDHGRAESLLIAAYGHVADGAAAAAEEDELCARVRAALTDRGLVREEGGALPYFGPYFGMTGDELRKELKARGCKVRERRRSSSFVSRRTTRSRRRRRPQRRDDSSTHHSSFVFTTSTTI